MTRLWGALGRGRLGLLLKLALTVVLIGYIARSIDGAALVAQLRRVGVWVCVLCVLLNLFQSAILGYRWYRILHAAGVAIAFGRALRIVLVGLFFNQCLPTSLGGDGMRVLMVRAPDVPLERAVNVVLVDRLSGLMGLIPFLLCGLPFLLSWAPSAVFGITSLAIALVFCAVLIVYFFGDLAIGRVRRLAGLRFFQAIAGASFFARVVVWQAKGASLTFALALLVHFVTVVVVVTLARTLGAPLTLGAGLVLVPPVIAAAMLPVSFGGWGAREVVMIASLATAGVPAATALAVSILLGFLALLSTAPGAVLWLVNRKAAQATGAGPRSAGAARAVLRRSS